MPFRGPETSASLSAVDEVFGPFRLIALIARGGMAETYIGVRTGPAGFEQRVCVKRILGPQQGDPKWIALFKKEARIAGMLRHQNIALLLDFNRERGVWWMSFELIEGATLRAIMTMHKRNGTRVPVDAVLFVATELASALAYAHGQKALDGSPAPVVHRDVTPTNILISNTGAVKLVDFGIATVLDKERTRTGKGAGKVGYMSLEQCHANEDVYPVDHRTDLFSLGVVLFEMLTGTRPYDGATEWATKLNVANGKRKDLRALAPETPEALVQIVESLTESSAEARMPSAEALRDALDRIPARGNAARMLEAMAKEAMADHAARER